MDIQSVYFAFYFNYEHNWQVYNAKGDGQQSITYAPLDTSTDATWRKKS